MQEFDMNDPNLELEMPDDYNPEAELGGGIPQPPADGNNQVALFLAEDTENKAAVRFSKGKVVATFRVRAVKEDGELGAYLKDYYPTSQVFEGQHTSALANLCRLAGKPVTARQAPEFIKHIYSVFSPDEPFVCTAKTQWIKSTPKVDPETGEHAIDPTTGYKQYDEIKGMAKVKASAIADVQRRAAAEGWDSDALEAGLDYATRHPHLYIDPISGDEKSARAEVRYVVGK
jgi:hypothetical protein